MADTTTPAAPVRVLAGMELACMVAAMMALNALAIDVMLPALPQIGASLRVTSENDRQLVIVVYVLSSGFAQLFFGPLADAIGRRKVLLGALGIYLVGALLCLAATTFPLLLAARVVQGVTAAAVRVVSTALVRDLVSGSRMAQVMSTAMTIFFVVPLLAPSIGQGILFLGPWRWIFALLLVYGVIMFAWCYYRVPETLTAAQRKPLNARNATHAYVQVLKNRTTVGYTLAQSLMFSGLFAFLTSSQQVFVEIYQLGPLFALAFAAIAGTLSLAQFVNSRLVMRVGMRRMAHIAAVGFSVVAAAHAVHAHFGAESLPVFLGLLLPAMFLFGFIGANSSAIAMEPMGEIAGSAAALTGFFSTVVGATIGGAVGHLYDGTIVPLLTAQAVLGIAAVATLLITERGRLFHIEHPAEPLF